MLIIIDHDLSQTYFNNSEIILLAKNTNQMDLGDESKNKRTGEQEIKSEKKKTTDDNEEEEIVEKVEEDIKQSENNGEFEKVHDTRSEEEILKERQEAYYRSMLGLTAHEFDSIKRFQKIMLDYIGTT